MSVRRYRLQHQGGLLGCCSTSRRCHPHPDSDKIRSPRNDCRVRSVAGLQHGRRQWVQPPHCEPFAPLRRSSDGCTHERSGEHVDAGQATEQEGVWHREVSDRYLPYRVHVAVEVRSRPLREHPS